MKIHERIEAGMEQRANDDGHVRQLTREEGRELLDRHARRYLGISGEEFIRRWDAGEYGDPDDRTQNPPGVM
ncbi:MAG: hypothetical protein ACRDSJ_18850 [Rubrobacteraceae bacterium]